MEQRYIEFIQDLLITIHANIHELKDRRAFAEAKELPYIEAKLMAYQEFLASIKAGAEQFKLPTKDLGL